MELTFSRFKAGTVTTLEGPICAGKSTLLRTLKKNAVLDDSGCPVIYYDEQIDPAIIEEYKHKLHTCKDWNETMLWTMNLQKKIMYAREVVMREAQQLAKQGRAVVIERGTLGNLVFALRALKQFLHERDMIKEFIRYMLLLVSQLHMRSGIGTCPAITVYMKTDVDESIRRNSLRDESPYDDSYMRDVQELYEMCLETSPKEDVYLFDTEKVAEEMGYDSIDNLVELIPGEVKIHMFKTDVYKFFMRALCLAYENKRQKQQQ